VLAATGIVFGHWSGRLRSNRPRLVEPFVVYPLVPVAAPAQQRPTTLDEALEQLRRNPEQPVQASIGELEIELRVIGRTKDLGQGGTYDSLLASAGTAEALGDDVGRRKQAHLAEIYAPKRNGR
jgi:hypothetical protein